MTRSRYMGQFPPEFSRLHADRDLVWAVPPRIDRLLVVAGDRFAGGSTVISYLAWRHGFYVIRATSILRAEAARRGVSTRRRAELFRFADELRAEHDDPAYLGRQVLRRARRLQLAQGRPSLPTDLAVDGIRHYRELQVLERVNCCQLLEVNADQETRCHRGHSAGTLEQAFVDDDDPAHDAETYGKLDATGRLEYLRELDTHERAGMQSPFAKEFRGGLTKLFQESKTRQELSNEATNRAALYGDIDQLVEPQRFGIAGVTV